MASDDPVIHDIVSRQERMFRLARRDHGLTDKILNLETGIPIPTLVSYRRGAAMPVHALVKLARIIPDELTSLLVEPAGKIIGTAEPDDGDLDALGCEAAGFTAEYVEAKRDGKVTPIERANLADRARRISAKARAVAA